MAPDVASPKCPLAMVNYDPAAAQWRAGKRKRQEEEAEATSSRAVKRERLEKEASELSSRACAGANVPQAAVAPPVILDVKPINVVAPRQPPRTARQLPPPLAASEVPPCLREHFLSAMGLRPDLPVHFIAEKGMTKTDLNAQQHRFRIPLDGNKLRLLREILTPAELDAANLLHDMAPRPRNKPKKQAADDEAGTEQGKKIKEPKKKGKVHGGLRVKLVHLTAGAKELQMTRWDSNGAAVVKGEGYVDFIHRCSFREDDTVEIWAFIQRPVRIFGAEVQHGDGVLNLLVAKKQLPPQRCCYCPILHAQ